MADEKQETTPPLPPWLIITLLVILGFFIVGAVNNSQKQNQVVRPDSTAPPAPVVPDIPDFAAALSQGKALCEGRARQVKQMAKEGRIAKANLDQGRKLYTDAKAEFDGCITFLVTGLARRFNDEDPAKVKQRLTKANDQMSAFVKWADIQIKPGIGATGGPIGEAIDALGKWLNGLSEQNEKAIEHLIKAMEQCRLRDWGDLPDDRGGANEN